MQWDRVDDERLRLRNAQGDELVFTFNKDTGDVEIRFSEMFERESKLFAIRPEVVEDFLLDFKDWQDIQPKPLLSDME